LVLLTMPLLWAAALVLPVFGDPAAVVFTSLYSFTGANDGAYPRAALVQGREGNFYGTTDGGGAYPNHFGHGYGTVFKVGPDGTLTNSYAFTGTSDGAFPQGGLVRGSDGCFDGTTSDGGTNNQGTVFRLTILPAFQTVASPTAR
jgi:uncharacterized repeat protein (TIGR03803 family)